MANDPREPLSPEEAALSRVYAALPRPEPSPALDAAVLAQARAALDPASARAPAPVRRRRRPWYLMPGTGVAAAAVLAAGISWQVGLLDDNGMDGVSTQSAPATSPEARKPAAAARKDSVDVEFLRREQAQRAAESGSEAADAAAPKRESKATPAPPISRERAAARAPQAFPAPPAPASAPAEALAEPAPAPAEDRSSPAPAPSSAAPAPGASMAERNAYEQEHSATLDRVEVTGSRIQRADVSLPPWSEDSRLTPDAWLERVRERVRHGDREGARSSLRRFTREHPSLPVPEELTLLLVQ